MKTTNPPMETPEHVVHTSYYSPIMGQDVGYNAYLPADYGEGAGRYPVVYHIHGWQGDESTDLWPLERVCRGRRAITVFMNAISSETTYFDALLQIESMLVGELIPHIDGQYRTEAGRAGRGLSGFSMGGAMAFYYAVKHPGLFCAVTTYAGTFHHQYHLGYAGVGKPPEAAAGLYQAMLREERHREENNILCLVRRNLEAASGGLRIALHIGVNDPVFCDNEILHLDLCSLGIPHEYQIIPGTGHELEKIV